MWQEMSFIEKRLSELRAVAGTAHPVRSVKKAVRKVSKRVRQRREVTPEVAASRKVQGQYLGFMRQIPEGDRKRFQDIARTKGRELAIAAMRKRLGK